MYPPKELRVEVFIGSPFYDLGFIFLSNPTSIPRCNCGGMNYQEIQKENKNNKD
jgi:hypothetical protein